MSSNDDHNPPISSLVGKIHSGEISSSQHLNAVRQEIQNKESQLHAWEIIVDDAPKEKTDQHRPLDGVAVGVKDIIDCAGMPTRCGSSVTSPVPKERDAPIVGKLKKLGASIQGKTVTTEFGYFQPGKTLNPHAPSHTPGGSSSGSASAVGAGVIPLALGTQTAGSLTRPASYCGATGLVLTKGRESTEGITGLSHTLDSIGLLTRTADDMSYVFDTLYPDAPRARAAHVHIWHGSDILPLEPEMQILLRLVPELLSLQDLPASRLEWDDHVSTLVDDHRCVMAYEAARSTAHTLADVREHLSPQLNELFDSGAAISESDYREALVRSEASSNILLEYLLKTNGIIIGPAAQGPAPRREAGTGSPDLSRPWQLLGLPVVSVAGATSLNGLPLGLQLIGWKNQERLLIDVAQRIEPLLKALPRISRSDTHDAILPLLKDMKW